jgi:Domain of unknown function (DUF4189)
MKTEILLALGLLSANGLVSAQCVPGFPSCVPPEVAYGSQGLDANGRPLGQPSSQTATRVAWEDRWGAFAADGPSGILGTAKGMTSKREAEKAALSQCKNRGGRACEVDLAFHNQCAVLVTGDNGYIVQGAPTVEQASQIGMQKCTALGSNCRVYHFECSMSELVQQ